MPGTIFSRQTMKNRDWKEARSHVQGNLIQFDRAMFESKLDAMVREKVERIVNAMPDASGGRDRQRRHRLRCPGLVWHHRADSVDV